MPLQSELVATAAFTPEQFANFASHLDRAWIDEALISTGVATLRKRRLPMDRVVWLVIGMGLMRDLPIRDVLDKLDLAVPDGTTRTVASSAVSQARQRLGAAPVEWLFLRTGSEWATESARRHTWRGLGLYGLDGTTLRVADTEENRKHFGGQSGPRGDSGYPQLRLNVLMALRSHLLAGAAFGPYNVDERTLAAELWPSVPDASLVLLDRGYLQANVLVPLVRDGNNRHWLTRAKSSSAWTVIKRLGPKDLLVEMKVSSMARQKDRSLPETFRARAIGYQRKGYQPQTLLTSLLDPKKYPADEIRDLYHERWEIELGYDELKTELLEQYEALRSQSPEGVAQELWGVLLAYNLVRREIEGIAEEVKEEPTRISFVSALRLIIDQLEWAIITSPGAIPKRLASLRDKVRRYCLPKRRPRKSYPRAVKIKMSNYARNRPRKRR